MKDAIRYSLRWQTWVYGLLSAAIGGGAVAVCAIAIKPSAFNIHDQLADTLKLFAATGILSAISFLKQSPLPPLEETSEGEALAEPKQKIMGLVFALLLPLATFAADPVPANTLSKLDWTPSPASEAVTEYLVDISRGTNYAPFVTYSATNPPVAVWPSFAAQTNGVYSINLRAVGQSGLISAPSTNLVIFWYGNVPSNPPPARLVQTNLVPFPPMPK